ncbi:hypothetical protein [Staphylococcus hominis]|uniref:hypothetical protein n=1 Tax=Staphylococcus hominis TaxID=1290 RepID=UPI002DD6B814|nr:hypothetical protein [Staphylococcus hominis]WRY66266.1 hypothetical protein P8632_02745 [Staphylococcus hominis]
MKDFLIKYLLLLIIGSATIIFCLAAIMQNIFNMELKDSLSILIAFISIFTTFGGAYLGAKISGEENIKLEEQRQSKEYKKEAFILKNEIVEYINKIEKNICDWEKNYEIFVIKMFNGENEGDPPFEEEEELLNALEYFYKERNNVDLKIGELLSNSFIFSLKENDKEFYKNLLEYRRLFSDIAHYASKLLEYKNKNIQKYNEYKENNHDIIDVDIEKITKLSIKFKKRNSLL